MPTMWRKITSHSYYLFLRGFFRVPRHVGARLTLRKLLNLYLLRWEYERGYTVVRSHPMKLTVEAANVCNLRCPACFTGAGEVGRVRSMMTVELYRKLLDELGDYLFELEFYNWGEPLLNKFIYTMIQEAAERGIATIVSTNFSIPFDAEKAERLVCSGLAVLGVSIDGAQQHTYEQYRVRGNLDLVLRNCRLVAEAKKKLGSATPHMVWEYHVFPHNTGDVELARSMARDLGMECNVSKGWLPGPDWDTERKWSFVHEPMPGHCHFLWRQAVVNNDGGFSPCCGTFYHEDDMGKLAIDPGEVGGRSFREVWNGEKFRAARQLYHSRSGSEETRKSICFDCPSTIIWEKWLRHAAAGGTLGTFEPGFRTYDSFNYFHSRKPVRAEARR
jgi:pyruvate-formate lyase-activating enzyme